MTIQGFIDGLFLLVFGYLAITIWNHRGVI